MEASLGAEDCETFFVSCCCEERIGEVLVEYGLRLFKG